MPKTFLMHDEKMVTRVVRSVPLTAFPWAINRIGQIVYIDCKDDQQAPRTPVPPTLVPYTKATSMDRRRKCQSIMANIALTQRLYTSSAVTKVSLGVVDYILHSLKTDKSIRAEIEFCMDRYMYSPAGFGRLGQPGDKPTGAGELYRRCLTALTQGELPSILAIHDFMGRVVFRKLGGQKRERGSDKWMATNEKVPQSTIDIKQRNLIFGAGPSGSTGTLLQAGKLFGNLDGDLLRQYVWAIVGYLVGGGMHSYHEVMVIARMVGCPYKDGAYVPSLPDSFLRSQEYEEWQADYFER
jgi:hypothetical protein